MLSYWKFFEVDGVIVFVGVVAFVVVLVVFAVLVVVYSAVVHFHQAEKQEHLL